MPPVISDPAHNTPDWDSPGAGYLGDHSALGERHVYYLDSGAIAHVVALGADGAPIDTPLQEASEHVFQSQETRSSAADGAAVTAIRIA